MSIVDEIWKDIPDYEGFYQASNLGRVRSCDRTIVTSLGANQFLKGRILSPSVAGRYALVQVCKHGVRTMVAVHILVARVFLGDRPDGLVINHIDGCRFNNSASNLEYCTQTENNHHARATGLNNAHGQNHKRSKLKDSDIAVIRDRLLNGEKQTSIARDYGVDKQIISRISRKRSWNGVA
jgi:hypothetical protein